MSHHTPQRDGHDAHATGGLEVEKWILRLQLLTMVALVVAAIVASRDDIRRYLKIKQM